MLATVGADGLTSITAARNPMPAEPTASPVSAMAMGSRRR